MKYQLSLFAAVILIWCSGAMGQWVDISNVDVKQDPTELAGPRTVIEYDLNDKDVSPDMPAYVFVRYSIDFGATWKLLPMRYLKGNGYDLVEKPGHKKIIWWGTGQTGFADLAQVEFRVRGIKMARVAGGEFIMKSIPGADRDETKEQKPVTSLPDFYLAKCETTISMYVDYLNEVGDEGAGWNQRMTHSSRCGIEKHNDNTYSVKPDRGNYPIGYVSWYDAAGFLQWCGLTLPTEAQWEKALHGGNYLDGDKTKKKLNPNPQRRFPWGNESPDADGVHRCNYDGADDGFEYTAPVGSFGKFNSPYGICDLVGNMAEWTLDWYTTSFHVGLDGFRMVRGGSWMAVPAACDAITGATQLPLKESSIMGFRGIRNSSTPRLCSEHKLTPPNPPAN